MYYILQYELLKNKIRASPGNLEVKTSHSSAGGVGSIPGQSTKIPQALQPKNQNIKQKQYYNKFNKDFFKLSTSKPKNVLKNKIIKIIKLFGLVSDTLSSAINFTNKKKKHFFSI